MGRVTKQVSIKGKMYSITPWSGTKAARMLAKLVKLLGPAFGTLMSSAGSLKGLLDSKTSEVNFSEVFMSLADRLDDQNFDLLMKELLEGVHDGAKAVTDDFDSRFSGEVATMFSLVKASLEVNYGDFLDVIGKASAGSKASPAE